jgi:N-methylhydantoinase A/oxoprolinase/acetone carboxylase beta subunit
MLESRVSSSFIFMPTPLRIAIDSGGTFTDCVWLQASALRILKVFSTPADPAQAIAEAVNRISGDSKNVTVLHGTTVGTNTLLQRKGARDLRTPSKLAASTGPGSTISFLRKTLHCLQRSCVLA